MTTRNKWVTYSVNYIFFKQIEKISAIATTNQQTEKFVGVLERTKGYNLNQTEKFEGTSFDFRKREKKFRQGEIPCICQTLLTNLVVTREQSACVNLDTVI